MHLNLTRRKPRWWPTTAQAAARKVANRDA
jgi:hypothetical protein